MSNDHLPAGFQTITPYLVVPDPEALIEFLTQAWGATTHERMEQDGRVRHAQVQVGTSMLMMGRAQDEHPALKSMLYLYVEDADDWYARALQAGATSQQAPRTEPYGDRTAAVIGPCENTWYVATRLENLSPDEVATRMAAG